MHTQDYEKIWDQYSDKFGATPKTENVANLGEEWRNLESSRALFEKLIKPHLHSDMEIGELGVGGGKYTTMAADIVRKVYGIDISSNMLARTAERMKGSRCEFVPTKCHDSKIELPDQTLDFFFSLDSMVHIFPYDLYSYIHEIARVLRPGSVAVIEYACWDRPEALQKFKMDHDHFVKHRQLSLGAFGFISASAMSWFSESAGLSLIHDGYISKRTSAVLLKKA